MLYIFVSKENNCHTYFLNTYTFHWLDLLSASGGICPLNRERSNGKVKTGAQHKLDTYRTCCTWDYHLCPQASTTGTLLAATHGWCGYIVNEEYFDCGTQGLICMPPGVQIFLLLSSSYSTGPFLNEVATNLPTARYMPILLKNCYLFKYSFRFAIHFLL